MRLHLFLIPAVLSLGPPANAQFPFGSPYPSRGGQTGEAIEQLDVRIDHDWRFGIISRADWERLRAAPARLRQVMSEYGRDGWSSWEASDIVRQIDRLRGAVADAERESIARASLGPGRLNDATQPSAAPEEHGLADGPLADGEDGIDEPGGAYPEPLRVGDPAPINLGLLPQELRTRFRDGNGSYYRYWGGTVYQVDERTDTIRWIGRARDRP